MGKIYVGNSSGKAKYVKEVYFGINNIAKNIKKVYIGVNGIAKLCYTKIYKTFTKKPSITTPFSGIVKEFATFVTIGSNDDKLLIAGGYDRTTAPKSPVYCKDVVVYDRNLVKSMGPDLSYALNLCSGVNFYGRAVIYPGYNDSSAGSAYPYNYIDIINSNLTRNTISGYPFPQRLYSRPIVKTDNHIVYGASKSRKDTGFDKRVDILDKSLTFVKADEMTARENISTGMVNNCAVFCGGEWGESIYGSGVAFDQSLTKINLAAYACHGSADFQFENACCFAGGTSNYSNTNPNAMIRYYDSSLTIHQLNYLPYRSQLVGQTRDFALLIDGLKREKDPNNDVYYWYIKKDIVKVDKSLTYSLSSIQMNENYVNITKIDNRLFMFANKMSTSNVDVIELG